MTDKTIDRLTILGVIVLVIFLATLIAALAGEAY